MFDEIPTGRKQRFVGMGLALMVGVLALGLRAWGAGWSLPYVDHPDEPAVVNQVLRMVEGQLNPDTFFYPTLMKYVLALVFKLHFWWGLQTGLYTGSLDLPRTTDFYTTIPQAYVWGRLVTAVMGAGTVLALVVWGGQYVGRAAALIGATLLAVSAWAIDHGHFIAVDIPAAFTGTLAVLGAVHLLRNGTWRAYLLAGVLIGLAAGTKYQNALVAVPVILAHGIYWWRTGGHAGITARAFVRLASAGVLSIGIFLLTSPYIVLDFASFSRDFTTLISSYGGEHGDITGAWPVADYARFLWQDGLHPLPCVLILLGMVGLIRRDPATALVLLAFPLVLLVTLLRLETHFFRNFLPAQPVLLLFAGVGCIAIWDSLSTRLSRRLLLAVAGAGMLLLVGTVSIGGVQRSIQFAKPDSRVTAQEWVRTHWPGVRVASEIAHPLRWNGVTQAVYAHYLPLHPNTWYREQGYSLLLASSDKRHTWDWTDDYAPLIEQTEVVAGFGGPQSAWRGPRIDILATGLTTRTLPVDTPGAMIGPLSLPGVQYGRLVQHTDGPELLVGEAVHIGDVLGITAFWTINEAVTPGDYMVFVHLRDDQGRTVAQRDAPPWQNLFPPQIWQPGRLVTESLDLSIPDNLPPGDYDLFIGLYDPIQQTRFAALHAGMRLPQDEVYLGQVRVIE